MATGPAGTEADDGPAGTEADDGPAGTEATAGPAGLEATAGTESSGGPAGLEATAGRTTGSTRLSIRRRQLTILGVAAVTVALDQLSKTWALHHSREPIHVIWTLRLAVTFNFGTAFGLGQNSSSIIVAGVVLLVVVLLGLGRKASRTANWPATIAMGLLLGGALGNLADRLVRHHHGAVIDFIDLRWWPVFNLADASITIGAVLLVLISLRARPVT